MRRSAQTLDTIKRKSAELLVQGVSPRRLALTLALGFVIGCLPLLGLPTALCALIAIAFRLNQPAIQLANYAAMPLQVALIVPFIRLGGKLSQTGFGRIDGVSWMSHLAATTAGHPSTQFAMQAGGMAGRAVLAWLLVSVPVVLLLTPALTMLLRRIPALADSPKEELI